jgi:5'-methylthioadenosine phosphorylase
MAGWTLGVIGGSGLYEIEGLEDRRWVRVESPFGEPSDELLTGRIGAVRLVFLPRHGRGHRLPPSDINARANIDVLKRAGCTDVISISAVGSFKEELAPGTFVVVDQYIDRTFAREKSFFGPGLTAHVSVAHPVCPRLSGLAAEAARTAGATVVEGGTYLAMEGPQFSTLAESLLYRSWGCSVIGMTGMPEAKLAREAELPFCTLALSTDYDCWHAGEEAVTVEAVVATLRKNVARAKATIVALGKALPDVSDSPAANALKNAVMTDRAHLTPAIRQKLGWLLDKYA